METNPTYYIDLITRYFFAEATPEEIRELETWVMTDPANATIFSAYRKTWETIENDRIKSSVNLSDEWNILVSKLKTHDEDLPNAPLQLSSPQPSIVHRPSSTVNRQSSIVNRQSKILSWSLRAAALFLLLAIPTYFFFRHFNAPAEMTLTATTDIAERTLPDGTTVTLNTGATMTCPSRFEGSFRKVTLQGEAWFEVAHDKTKPFIVAAGNARIRVVGTSFFVNTNTSKANEEIILSSGIVKVYYENNPEKVATLYPGDKAELYAAGDAIIKTTNQDVNFLAWKTKHLVFNNTPLNEVAALLTRVYHTSVRLSDDRLSDCRITTTFDRQSLESVLNVLKATLDLQVRSNGSGIELSGHGCNRNK